MASMECEQEMNIWEINLEVACLESGGGLHAWQTQHDRQSFGIVKTVIFVLTLEKNETSGEV